MRNRISSIVSNWEREVKVLDPNEPNDKEIEDALETVNEITDIFTFVEELQISLSILRRSSKLNENERNFIKEFGPGIEKLFEASQTLSRAIGDAIIDIL